MFERARRTRCEAEECGAEIVVIRADRPRTVMVLDAEPHPVGNIRIVNGPNGPVAHRLSTQELHALPRSVRRWASHFATCPYVELHRRGSSHRRGM